MELSERKCVEDGENRQRTIKFINKTSQSITQHFIFCTVKTLYCQGDMFRPLLGHLQALWKNRPKNYLYRHR